MRNTLLVIRQEIITTFSRRSFLLFAFGVPLLAILVVGGMRLIQERRGDQNPASGGGSGAQSKYDLQVEGYVDHSGLILSLPADFPQDRLIRYPDEQQASQALQSTDISAYYVIPPDYLEQGVIFYVYPDTKSYLADGQEWVIQWVLTTNLLEGDLALADRVWNPVWNLKVTRLSAQNQAGAGSGEDCSRPGTACQSNDLVRYLPSIMVVLLYTALMISSSMLFHSIGNEKDNRVIEVILLSISSRQLLGGKTIAIGFCGLIQIATWLGAAFLMLNLAGQTLSLPADFNFPLDILLWSLLLFLAGYALYASLMAGAGALVPKMKEAGMANFIAMAPLLFAYMIGLLAPLARVTEATLPVALSLFPLTAPVLMVMRLTSGSVPVWQLLLALGLTCLAAWLALRSAAAMFHAQNLLSGQSFSLRRYASALVGKG
jgi:ABC-2 type transport system permease protein